MSNLKELAKQVIYGSYTPGVHDAELIKGIEHLQADNTRLEYELAEAKEENERANTRLAAHEILRDGLWKRNDQLQARVDEQIKAIDSFIASIYECSSIEELRKRARERIKALQQLLGLAGKE